MLGEIRRFLRQDRDYFINNTGDIEAETERVLRVSCVLYAAVMILFTAQTYAMKTSRLLLTMYLVYDAIHVVLCLCTFWRSGRPVSAGRVYLLRTLLEVSVLSFFVIEAVFPFPDQPCLYYPFPILLLVVVFPYRTGKALSLILSYIASFVVLQLIFKAPQTRMHDLLTAAGTLISSMVGYVIVATLRHETGGVMNRLKHLSMIDPLTGLYNRRTFEPLCKAFMAEDGGKRQYAMLFFDIDKFKQINDVYGHPFGDRVLRDVAQQMRETFYEKDYLCRYGGDEYVAFLADISSESDVGERVKAFNRRIKALGDALGLSDLSISVGAAMKSGVQEPYAELLSRADGALYVAKRGDIEGVVFHGADTDQADQEEVSGKHKILVVDDNEMNRQLLNKILSVEYDVLEAGNGAEAMRVLAQSFGEISAILLDIVMPIMDGYQVLAAMREADDYRDIPVIVTTSYGEEEAEIKALSLGANDFIVKPYRPDIIIHRLKNTIQLRESGKGDS